MELINRPENAYCHEVKGLRLGEFDMGGVLYHANYFHLYEMARESLLRNYESPYSELVSSGQHLPIVESHQKFICPIRYGQTLYVYLWVSELKARLFTLCYEITTVDSPETNLDSEFTQGEVCETTVHKAWTRQVFVDSSDGQFKTGRLPQKLLSIFQQLSITAA